MMPCRCLLWLRPTPRRRRSDSAGTRDRLATPIDLEYLRESLGPGVVKRAKNLEEYEHLDFIWGIDAKEALYDDVLRFLAADDSAGQQA